MNALEALMRGMDGDEGESPRPLPEAQIEVLREINERYQAGCPFKTGDLVTPRDGYNLRQAGEPHIVIQVLVEPAQNFADASESGSHRFARRIDMRVASLAQGEYTAHWVESWTFEAYTGAGV